MRTEHGSRKRAAGSAAQGAARLGIALLAGWAAAPSAQAGDAEVSVQLLVIRATKSNKEISPELKPIADALKGQFNFTGYKLVKRDSRGVALGKSATFGLTGPYSARITPKDRDERQVTLQIVVTEKRGEKDVEKSNVTVKVTKERYTLQGGLDLDGGDKLILAVSGK